MQVNLNSLPSEENNPVKAQGVLQGGGGVLLPSTELESTKVGNFMRTRTHCTGCDFREISSMLYSGWFLGRLPGEIVAPAETQN
jgi:hypothetical protein